MYDPAYVHENDWTVHSYPLSSGNTLRFCARNVRKESTGIHAQINININWVTLAWSNFNIERDEDRVRLSNSAYKHLDGEAFALDRNEWPQNQFKHGLDIFCVGLWDETVGNLMGGQMAGDEGVGRPKLLLGNYIIDGGGTILFAPPGRGKSYTAIAMAVCLTRGIDTIWQIGDTRSPLYINLERSAASMAWRLARVNKALRRPTDEPLPFLNARGRSLEEVYEAAARTMKAEGCDGVILDSISRAGTGDMTKDSPVNKTIDLLNRLGGYWLALGHTPRSDETHVYGSIHFEAGEDIGVQLASQSSLDMKVTGVGLKETKANDIPTGTTTMHALEWDDVGLVGLRKADNREFPSLSMGKDNPIEQVRDYLLLVQGASASQIASELGHDRTYWSRLLSKEPGFVQRKKGKMLEFFVEERSRVAQESHRWS